jgi:hypothetical protein
VAVDNRWWTLKDGNGAPIPLHKSLGICGPALPVEIAVPSDHAKKLAAAGKAVPASVQGVALIDTGATATCIDVSVSTKLGLVAINQTTVLTPAGPAVQSIYAVRLEFPGCTLSAVDSWFALGSQLASSGQSVAGAPIMVLLGRDYLGGKLLVYNGLGGTWSLAE